MVAAGTAQLLSTLHSFVAGGAFDDLRPDRPCRSSRMNKNTSSLVWTPQWQHLPRTQARS